MNTRSNPQPTLRNSSLVLVCAALLYFGLSATATGAAEPDPLGKKLFIKNKCTQCHTITALKIVKEEGEEEDEEVAEGEEKRDPPDLSGVGNEQKPEWIVKFLKKIEKREGRKHKKKFKGSDEDLQTIADWLGTLKFDVPKKKK